MALHLAEKPRLSARFKERGQIVLAIDGLQPDVGHEVLWVLRDCLSGEVLLAQSLLSAWSPKNVNAGHLFPIDKTHKAK